MDGWLNLAVISDNFVYFMVGRYPHGPLGGLALTIWLALASGCLSILGGLLLGLLSAARHPVVRWLSLGFINLVRGVPLLMVVFWTYFLLPALLGREVGESLTVIAALSLFTSVYMAGIVRAGIAAVPPGQREAGLSTGLRPWQVMAFVILPQGLRHMLPSLVNQFVSLIKDTSLAFIVGVSELTQVATQVNNRSLVHPTEIFAFIALLYFLLCYALTSFSRWLERRLSWSRRG